MRKKRLFLSICTFILSICCVCGVKTVLSVKADENKTVAIATTNLPKEQGIWYGDPGNFNTYVASWNPEKLSLSPGHSFSVAVKFTAPCDGTVEHVLTDNYVFAPNDPSLSGRDPTRFAIIVGEKVAYPANGGFANIPYSESKALHFSTAQLSLKAGESMYYVVENGGAGNGAYDGAELKANFIWKDAQNPNGVTVSVKDNYYYDEANQVVTFGNYARKDVFSYVKVNALKEIEDKFQTQTQGVEVDFKSGNLQYVELNGGYLWGGVYDDAYNYVLNAGIGVGKYNGVMISFTAPCDGEVSNDFGNGWVRYNVDPTAPETIDGIRMNVVYDNHEKKEIVFPYNGLWQDVPMSGEQMPVLYNDISMKAGETIYYIFNNGGDSNALWDAAEYNISFLWKTATGAQFIDLASEYYTKDQMNNNVSFGNYKKSEVIGYHWVKFYDCLPVGEAQEFVGTSIEPSEKFELGYIDDNETSHYYLTGDNLLVYETWLQPGFSAAIGVEWTAPNDGRVDLSQTWLKIIDWCAEFLETPNEFGVYANGVRIRILKNDTEQLYPLQGEWELLAQKEMLTLSDIPVFNVSAGDTLMLVIDCNDELNWDCLEANFIIKFAETGSDYTQTDNSVFNFYDEDSNFKYYSVLKNEGDRKLVSGESEIKQLQFVAGGSGCASSFVGAGMVGAISILTAGVFVLQRKTKKDGDK